MITLLRVAGNTRYPPETATPGTLLKISTRVSETTPAQVRPVWDNAATTTNSRLEQIQISAPETCLGDRAGTPALDQVSSLLYDIRCGTSTHQAYPDSDTIPGNLPGGQGGYAGRGGGGGTFSPWHTTRIRAPLTIHPIHQAAAQTWAPCLRTPWRAAGFQSASSDKTPPPTAADPVPLLLPLGGAVIGLEPPPATSS